jgi:hypothetical protein
VRYLPVLAAWLLAALLVAGTFATSRVQAHDFGVEDEFSSGRWEGERAKPGPV